MADVSLEVFFRLVFGRAPGYACIAFIPAEGRGINERFFLWPDQEAEMVQAIRMNQGAANVYFCPHLFEKPKRSKELVSYAPCAWADLDTCTPDKLLVDPSIIIESSPNRYQALWCFERPWTSYDAEALSMRIAYAHSHHGADRSGWDLTQLLRVPGTHNFKYAERPTVKILNATSKRYRGRDFTEYPEVKNTSLLTLPLPEAGDLPQGVDPLDLMQKYRIRLNPQAFWLYDNEPEPNSWSEALWKLMMYLFEGGLTREEVFYVAQAAKCNKYKRDNKPPSYLWRDVCRAFLRNEENVNFVVTTSELSELLSPEELAWAEAQETFVERYTSWATGLGDAASQYHPAGAFTILSSLLAGRVRLPTSFGNVGLNLWFMILADTTLTRKSTAMDIAIDLLALVDEDAILATDGSIEGLMTGLQGRSNRPSVFLRDEFSGLIEQMTKKDYYAGMIEVLTKLYDGKMQKRLLRKETITILNPQLIILAGGIKSKVQSLLSFEHISSGFIPRFIFITAESSTARMQPLGPPTERDYSGRDELLDEMRRIYEHYVVIDSIEVKGQGFKVAQHRMWDAALTSQAWARYNKFESAMLQDGIDSGAGELMTPVYDRLSKSTLKAAVLLASARQVGCDDVVVEESDVVLAIKYCIGWRKYANDVINGVGKNTYERQLERILKAITMNPGISRSRLMQNFHLTAREADATFSTLEQRGQITISKVGKGATFFPVST